MLLGIMGIEEKEESFFDKEFDHQNLIGSSIICIEFMEEFLVVWTLCFSC